VGRSQPASPGPARFSFAGATARNTVDEFMLKAVRAIDLASAPPKSSPAASKKKSAPAGAAAPQSLSERVAAAFVKKAGEADETTVAAGDGVWLTGTLAPLLAASGSQAASQFDGKLLISKTRVGLEFDVKASFQPAPTSAPGGIDGTANLSILVTAFISSGTGQSRQGASYTPVLAGRYVRVPGSTADVGGESLTLSRQGLDLARLSHRWDTSVSPERMVTLELLGVSGNNQPALEPALGLTLDEEPRVLEASNAFHRLAVDALDAIQGLRPDLPTIDEDAEAVLFAPLDVAPTSSDALAINATVDWVLFHRRRSKQCARKVEAPAPLSPRRYRVRELTADTLEDAKHLYELAHDPQATSQQVLAARLGTDKVEVVVEFDPERSDLLSSRNAFAQDWSTFTPGKSLEYAVIASEGQSRTIERRRLGELISAIPTAVTDITPASAEGRSDPLVTVPPSLHDLSTDGTILFITRTVQTPGVLEISPTTFTYDVAVPGQGKQEQIFTVTNKGGQTTGAINIALGGANADEFVIAGNNLNGPLAPKAAGTLTVRFTPKSPGAKSATVTASANPGGVAIATISGTGVEAGAPRLSPATADLGAVEVGKVSQPVPFTVINAGAGLVKVGTVTASPGDFAITDNLCANAQLGGNQTCTIIVAFKPGSAGTKTGTLTVTTDTGQTLTSTLSGTGVTPVDLQTVRVIATSADPPAPADPSGLQIPMPVLRYKGDTALDAPIGAGEAKAMFELGLRKVPAGEMQLVTDATPAQAANRWATLATSMKAQNLIGPNTKQTVRKFDTQSLVDLRKQGGVSVNDLALLVPAAAIVAGVRLVVVNLTKEPLGLIDPALPQPVMVWSPNDDVDNQLDAATAKRLRDKIGGSPAKGLLFITRAADTLANQRKQALARELVKNKLLAAGGEQVRVLKATDTDPADRYLTDGTTVVQDVALLGVTG